MSLKLIGIEGSLLPDSIVTWGAGALLRDDLVLNTITRRSLTEESAQRLSEENHLHLFKRQIAIDDQYADTRLVVAIVNIGAPLGSYFLAAHGKTVGLVKARNIDGWQHYVFQDRSDFDLYAKDVVQKILTNVMHAPDHRTPVAVQRHLGLVRHALTLIPSHPHLNAVRAYFTGNNPMMATIARASLKGESDLKTFDLLLQALQSDPSANYQLKYERGIAHGGGLDVPKAVSTLQAFSRASKALDKPLADEFPFLGHIPPPRLHHMEARSAHLYFYAQATDEDLLAERVARYLSLDLLERAMNGEVNLADVKQNRILQTSIKKLARPTEQTSLSHKPLRENALTAVNVYTPDDVQVIRSERLEMLGVISGLVDDSYAELLFPNDLRIMVSTEDNGDNAVPRGAETIQRDGSFLRKPCLITLAREHSLGGDAEFLLREIKLLDAGQRVTVTSMPSGVLKGAFLVGLSLKAKLNAEGDELETDLGNFDGVSSGTLDGAISLIQQLSAAATGFELELAAEGVRRLHPTQQIPATPLERILTVLDGRGGSATIDAILTDVWNRFGARMRVNNTRREVRFNPGLLRYANQDEDTIALTELGMHHFRAYRLAGGALQQLKTPANE